MSPFPHKRFRPVRARLGGIIKKLQGNKKDKPKHNKFLETHYYTPLR